MKKFIQQMICDICTTDSLTHEVAITTVVVDLTGHPKMAADVCEICSRTATLGEVLDLGRRLKPGPKKGAVRAVAGPVAPSKAVATHRATLKPKGAVKATVGSPKKAKLPKGVKALPEGRYLHVATGRETRNLAGMAAYLRGNQFK